MCRLFLSMHLDMPDSYIIYWVCSGYCRAAAAAGARAAAEDCDGDIEDGEGAGAGCEGDACAGGEDDKDDNGPGAANEEDDAGEASGADSATTPGAKKAAAVSGPPPCLALSMSGPVQRTPSPGCLRAPPRCVLNNKHPCNPNPVCCNIMISSAFLPRAAGGRIQKTCHMSIWNPDTLISRHIPSFTVI
jgi:hypothetical protein